jgi:predicted ATP-grasp superfamily ATP-dependent carboligase
VSSVIVVRGFTTLLVLVAAALVLAGGAPATPPVPGEAQAFAAVKHARLDASDKTEYRAEIARAAHLARTLPGGRWQHVVMALEQFSAFEKKLTKQRALILFGQLKANDDYFAHHYAPKDKYDFVDDDGVVYRYFAGHCFEFHPLANFGRLNALVAANDASGAQQLADALIARGVYQHGGGVGFEYEFAFGSGRPPWLSGMAQAVAAQAFAGAAALVPDEAAAYMREAHAAYAVVPRLLVKVAAGPWIRLYAFSSTPVFNAQLQTVLSLNAYAKAANDGAASALASRMQTSAAEMIGRFDTGYWTYYSLAGDPSPLDYQQFVVQLLHKLAPLDQRFASAAQRIGQYTSQPPAFQVATSSVGTMKFWLSKPSTVHIVSAAGPERTLSLVGGWHTIVWKLPKRAGFYPIAVSATDWAGNNASFQALPIVRASSAGTASNARRKADAGAAAAAPALSIGAGIDDPSGAGAAKALGLRVVRMTLAWPTDATTPDPAAVATLQSVPGSILELVVNPVPPDPTALAQYAASLVQQLPSLRELILAPSPSVSTAPAYAGAFAAVRSAVQAVAQIPVGVSIDGSSAPRSTVAALGRALGGDVPDVVAFRPAPVAATNQWTATQTGPLVTSLQSAFGNPPPVIVDGVAAPTSSTQGAQYVAAINAAACSTNVQAVILDRLADSADGTQTTGVYTAGGTAKPSAALVKAAAGPAQRGTIVCPGLAVDAAASSITYPTALDPSSAASVTFGCARDCLYLVSLVDASGKPVVARRGSMKGGAAAMVVGLPKTPLTSSSYTIDVRLVNTVNPGQVTQLTSPALSVG